jgi:GT2 family glycosyltransferase/tetratricopeptide (TPR) repeat protein/2-polyprenyl-3-methyl-5-hydroxy-6-metoxy-1,4-benzoquinol methylase
VGHDPHYYEYCRPEILALVPTTAKAILDVGCGAGSLGIILKQRQHCSVYGVELNEAVAKNAAAHLDRVWTGDIEAIELDLPAGYLDVIVCGDVLEHLREPRDVLRQLSRFLKPNGRLIASIPNVAHHSVIRGLLAGDWTYQPAGLLDETHLRFFTAREIEKLFFRAGFQIEQVTTTRGPGDAALDLKQTNGHVRLGRFAIGGLPPSSLDSLTAYQYLVVATPVPERCKGANKVISRHPHPGPLPKGEGVSFEGFNQGLTSVVMLTNNQLEYTKLCLASIRSRTDEPYEVIVVDNGSTDGTVEYLNALDGVRLIVNPENRGFPAAVNQGIREARGEYVLLLNNDCVVTTGWLSRMLDALNSSPDVGLAGPYSNCVSGEQQIPVDYRLLEEIDGFAWDWGQRHVGQRIETDRLVAFCLLVKRSVIERVGLLDERFGLGNFEDDDFCRRALAAGFKAAIAEDAFVHHFGSVTYKAMGIDFGALIDHNQRLFNEKWGAGFRTGAANEQEDAEVTERFPPLPLRPPVQERVGQALPDDRRSRVEQTCQAEPDLQPRPRLSLCMIVRDSARTLGACLESIRPWVDEIVVVDTGSRDTTTEIAKRYGAKLFYFPWCDDFSAARNESLSRATGEWLFWMDSDDTIDEVNGRKLRELVDGPHKPETIAYVAQVHCPHEQDGRDCTAVDHVKLFRNFPELRFEGRIHEQILPAINRLGGTIAWTDIFVVHSGSDLSPEGQARKLARDLRILTLEGNDRPNHPFTLFNLGMTYLELKRYDDATTCLSKTIEVAGPHESHVPKAFSLLVQALCSSGQWEQAVERCNEGLQRYPDDPELMFRSGVLAQHFGRTSDAEDYYLKVLHGKFEPRFRSIDRGILGYKTRQNLACLYGDTGRHAEAEEQWRLILMERPDYEWAWRGIVAALLKQGKITEAHNAIAESELLRKNQPLRKQLEADVELALGNVPAARRLLEQAIAEWPDNLELHDARCRLLFEHGEPNEAEAALHAFVDKFPNNPAGIYNLATIHLRLGRYEPAVESFRRSLALRPDWPPAYAHLSTCYEHLGRRAEAEAMRRQAHQNQHVAPKNGQRRPPDRHDGPWFQSADELADAVDTCFCAAERGESKLTAAILSVPGMTSTPIRHLLNRLGELPGCRYLEIGAFYGATLLAASYDNPGSFLSVDNFSKFNDPDPRPILHSNLSRFKDNCHVEFREQDCWRLPCELEPGSVNVYFYDGHHAFEAQRDALVRFADIVADPFVLIIDDWNFDYVQQGTRTALEQLGWSVRTEWCRETGYNGDADSWWNGLFVAVIEKVKQPPLGKRRWTAPIAALT